MSKNIRKRRERLWIENKGVCFYCGITTELPKRGSNPKKKPLNLATLDHLRTRLHIAYDVDGNPLPGCRHEPNNTNEERTVLSCWSCNQVRGIMDQKSTQPITIVYRKPINDG